MAITLLAGACTKDILSGTDESATLSDAKAKLIFTSADAEEGQLLVYFSEDAISTVESLVMTRSGGVATRSGIEGFDEVLEEIGVVSLKRLFTLNPKTEERTREAGLHRWYTVNFDTNVDLDEAALAMAACSEVNRVQFDIRLKQIEPALGTEIIETSVEDIPITRSSTSNFNDPLLKWQWNLINDGNTSIYSGIKEGADVRCEDAWRLCAGDPRVVVAVVDQAVRYDHEDLAANMWINSGEIEGNGIDDDGNGFIDDYYGYNFREDGGPLIVDTTTEGYHGTHVAGIVAAVNNNGLGICGVAGGTGNNDGVRIMSCQIYYGSLGGNSTRIANAFKYAADNGASILQCSFGYDAGIYTSDSTYESRHSAQYEAAQYFINTKNCDALDGGLVICAAGNDQTEMSIYPGAHEDFISVTSISCDFTPAYYTNYGYACNIAAPGGDYYQAYLDNSTSRTSVYSASSIGTSAYVYAQGTSMACPHVSGVAALGLSYALQLGKTFTVDEFKGLLLGSVYGIDEYCTGTKTYRSSGSNVYLDLSQYAGKMGSGAIDAYRMLMNVRGITCIPVSSNSQTVINVADYIGNGAATFELLSVSISEEDMESLGMSSEPVVNGSTITVECSKIGSGIINLSLIYGTSSGAGMIGATGTQEFALIARASHSGNGGWL